ncbi:hypothetical protein [Mycobacterium sp.]|uniref:hypothetical protein n=1 Tax=Mycobacterium sp. TaxID=1785 RepID=UPI003F960127
MRTDVEAHNPHGKGLASPDVALVGPPPNCSDLHLARAVGRAEAILSVCDRIPDAQNALAAELKALVEVVQQHLDPH